MLLMLCYIVPYMLCFYLQCAELAQEEGIKVRFYNFSFEIFGSYVQHKGVKQSLHWISGGVLASKPVANWNGGVFFGGVFLRVRKQIVHKSYFWVFEAEICMHFNFRLGPLKATDILAAMTLNMLVDTC